MKHSMHYLGTCESSYFSLQLLLLLFLSFLAVLSIHFQRPGEAIMAHKLRLSVVLSCCGAMCYAHGVATLSSPTTPAAPETKNPMSCKLRQNLKLIRPKCLQCNGVLCNMHGRAPLSSPLIPAAPAPDAVIAKQVLAPI